MRDSNSRHPRCKRGALPTELIALRVFRIMSAASVAVMYADRKKTARAFVKFFLFFFRTTFPVAKGEGQKAGNCGLFGKIRSRRRPYGFGENLRWRPAAVDKFFVFVGKSPENRGFAAIVFKGLPVFPDQNEEAYSFVVKPA